MRAELDDILRQRVEFMMHITKHRYYTDSSKPSRLLALMLKRQENQFDIPSINCPFDWLLEQPTLKTHLSNFLRIYTLQRIDFHRNYSICSLSIWIELTDNESRELNGPITLDELHTAFKLTNGALPRNWWDPCRAIFRIMEYCRSDLVRHY